mgnify:CR=1 FL=1
MGWNVVWFWFLQKYTGFTWSQIILLINPVLAVLTSRFLYYMFLLLISHDSAICLYIIYIGNNINGNLKSKVLLQHPIKKQSYKAGLRRMHIE